MACRYKYDQYVFFNSLKYILFFFIQFLKFFFIFLFVRNWIVMKHYKLHLTFLECWKNLFLSIVLLVNIKKFPNYFFCIFCILIVNFRWVTSYWTCARRSGKRKQINAGKQTDQPAGQQPGSSNAGPWKMVEMEWRALKIWTSSEMLVLLFSI